MREIQFAFRRLLKSPMQLSAGILAFMLGIGVNTAMFSLTDALLFRPLDLPARDSLVLRVESKRFLEPVERVDFARFSRRSGHVHSGPPGHANGPRNRIAP